MRLATFEIDGRETWGMVLWHPFFNEDWVFEPEGVKEAIKRYCGPTTGYFLNKPEFLAYETWPGELASFLALEEKGMAALRQMENFLKTFLEQSDQIAILKAGFPISRVILKAPIPRPRLYWGLVANCPTFLRNNPGKRLVNLFPLGHQRPQGSVVGAGECIVQPEKNFPWGFNVELGVIIGKKGRYINAEEAMEYVAGYTVVTDCSSAHPFTVMNGCNKGQTLPAGADWFQEATASWAGKMMDTLAPMGPYLVTKEEVGNPYDLLAYTRQSGMLRDRAHTGALILGIERVISWYSSFGTLYPGDVIHMATMGVDGLPCDTDMSFGPEDYIESEIEKIGKIRNPVVFAEKNEWRSKNDIGRSIHESPAVRYIYEREGAGLKTPKDWNIDNVRHFFTAYENYRKNEKNAFEAGNFISMHPRFLNGPSSSLGLSTQIIELPPRTTNLRIGIELAFVVKKFAFKVNKEQADQYILGYTPMVSISDQSFKEEVVEPASKGERGITAVYSRWGDGFNIVLNQPVIASSGDLRGNKMNLEIDSYGSVRGSLDEYIFNAPEMLEHITRYITLFPGDVVTLGSISETIAIPKNADFKGIVGKGSIEKLGTVQFILKK